MAQQTVQITRTELLEAYHTTDLKILCGQLKHAELKDTVAKFFDQHLAPYDVTGKSNQMKEVAKEFFQLTEKGIVNKVAKVMSGKELQALQERAMGIAAELETTRKDKSEAKAKVKPNIQETIDDRDFVRKKIARYTSEKLKIGSKLGDVLEAKADI